MAPRRRLGIPTDASAVMTVVSKTFVWAHASTGMYDLNPTDTVLAAIGDMLSFKLFCISQ